MSCTWVQCATFLRNQPRQIFLFTDHPEKYKLGRGRWDLASCQVSLNFRLAVPEEKSKMSQPIRGQDGNLVFRIRSKNTNLVEGVEILFPVEFCWIPFSGFRKEVENVSANQRPGRPSCFSDRPENTNLVEGVEILLSVKFRWITFSSFRGEVENVSANQRPGRPFCFSDRPDKHKLGRGRWDLAFCQVSLNFVQGFQRSRKCLSQSEARAAILFFFIRWINTNLVEGIEILFPVKFLLNSVQRFKRRSQKCLSQSEARAAILFFRSLRKTQTC